MFLLMNLLALLSLVNCHGHLRAPSTMAAWVAKGRLQTQQTFNPSFPVPQLGDLHKMYSALPTDCEVLIQVFGSSVNPSDITPNMAQFPHVMGSDMAGVVIGTQGSSCSRFQAGDKVWGDIGANTHTSSGTKTKELGGYGEYTLALETQISRMPTNIDFQEAGSLPKVALTSYKALVWYAGALNTTLWTRKPTVLVLGGSGGTGSTGIQLAKRFGAGAIITTTSSANFAYCQGLGATQLIDYHTQNWWDVLDANSVDVVYDTVGQSGTGDRAMTVLRSGGYFVTIAGALASKVKPGVTQHSFINSDTNLSNEKEMTALTDLVEDDALRMRSDAIFAVYDLQDMASAFATSKTGKTVGKIVITVQNATLA